MAAAGWRLYLSLNGSLVDRVACLHYMPSAVLVKHGHSRRNGGHMKAFDHTHYVPILKGKRAEFNAVAQLYASRRAGLTPLFDVVPVDWDYDDEQPKKAESAHLEATVTSMVKAWGADSPLYVDLSGAGLSDTVVGDPTGRHPCTFFFDYARAKGLLAIPVVPLAADAALQAAVVSIMAKDNRGAMVRVSSEDLSSHNVTQALSNLPASLGQLAGHIDLLIDMEDLDANAVFAYRMALMQLVPNLPHLNQWRTFTLAGSAFPQSLSGRPVGEFVTVPRVEWSLWTELITRLPLQVRRPTFGDYGVVHVDTPEIDMRFVDPRNNIRYTIDADWLIVRGHSRKKKLGPTNPQLCSMLMGHPAFRGQHFSAGDNQIVLCATGSAGVGNLMTWLQVGTNHHLTFVVDQLASRFASSAPASPGPVAGPGGGTA
jgi:hypothetical protein